MSIITTNNNYMIHQKINFSNEKKEKYGEILTPYVLINKMFNLLNDCDFSNPTTKWLDPGAGTGFFSIYLFYKLDEGLIDVIYDVEERRNHIIENMIYMVEIQNDNVKELRNIFGVKANIFNIDFITETNHISNIEFDYVIGNPPYNSNGVKKVPTNKNKNKKNDGKTIWFEFIKISLMLLKPNGKLIMIVPSIWMKPDKLNIYYFMLRHKIHKIHSLSNTETNKIFNGNAQTPTCYFLLENKINVNHNIINIFDNDRSKYIQYTITNNYPIPLFGISIVNKFMKYIDKFGCLQVIKTNMPGKHIKLSANKNETYSYENINSAKLDKFSNKPILDIKYSNEPCKYNKVKKLILPHKMYGFPYLDPEGKYGICNRDNYVILDNNIDNLNIIKEFLSTKTALYIYETTRYRMKYLEKYAFEFIPNIINISDFVIKRPITDETIGEFFGFDSYDIININKLHKKIYNFEYD